MNTQGEKSQFGDSHRADMHGMFCQDEAMQKSAATYSDEEQQPTHDALVDVYNRSETGTQSKRVFVSHGS